MALAPSSDLGQVLQAHPTSPSRVYPPRRWPWVVSGLVLVAVAAVAVWYFAIRGDGESNAAVHGPSGAPFTVTRPSGWEALPSDQLSGLPGSPLAVLRQTDGNGVVIVNSQPQTDASLADLSKRLEAKLSETIPDFKLVSKRTVTVNAGDALLISYARTKKGTANTLLVVPSPEGIYTLNAVVPAGQEDAAAEAGRILASFDL
jgi:hypothetical protein